MKEDRVNKEEERGERGRGEKAYRAKDVAFYVAFRDAEQGGRIMRRVRGNERFLVVLCFALLFFFSCLWSSCSGCFGLVFLAVFRLLVLSLFLDKF